MMLWATEIETAAQAAGQMSELARYQFWGVMVAILIGMPVIYYFSMRSTNTTSTHLIDRLAIGIDAMKHSIDQLAQQLAATTASIGSELNGINAKVDVMAADVDDLKDEFHDVAATVKEHGEILEVHEEQLQRRGRGRK